MRHRLKTETRANHDQLDRAISTLDLSDPGGYAIFLRTHASAYAALSKSLDPDRPIAGLIDQIVLMLGEDIATLGAGPPEALSAPAPPDPLGLRYVISGSHFGKGVLKKRWSKSQNPQVLAAGRYLDNTVLRTMWTQTLIQLETVPPQSERADQVVAGADTTFALFYRSLMANTASAAETL